MDKNTLKNYIEQIDAARFLDSKRMLRISKKMVTEARKDGDDVALAQAEYFFLEASYRLGQLNETMLKRGARVLEIARQYKMYELETKILNMIGIFLINQDDNIAAMEYYQMAMECATKHHYRGRVRVMANNIGDLFMKMKQYKEAMHYFEECLEKAMLIYEEGRRTGKEEIGISNINISLLNMANCQYALGNYEESIRLLHSFHKDKAGLEEAYYGPGKDGLFVLNYVKLGRESEIDSYAENVICAAEANKETIEMAEEYLMVCQALLEADHLEQALRLYMAMKGIAEKLDMTSVWCLYYETAIQFAKKTDDTVALTTAYENYIIAKKRQDEFMNKQQCRAIKNRQALNQALKKQKKAEEAKLSLKHMSEHDPLTGLYNRYVLNKECDKWWKNAVSKGSTVGVIVMDIDFFKQYNDTYGHIEGDACIKAVSRIIQDAVGSGGTVVRYGGDEFLILLRGLTTEEAMELAENINVRLRECAILHEKSLVSRYVTVSQGIANGTPEEGQSMANLTNLADNALYRAKEKRRGSVGIYRQNSYDVFTKEY